MRSNNNWWKRSTVVCSIYLAGSIRNVWIESKCMLDDGVGFQHIRQVYSFAKLATGKAPLTQCSVRMQWKTRELPSLVFAFFFVFDFHYLSRFLFIFRVFLSGEARLRLPVLSSARASFVCLQFQTRAFCIERTRQYSAYVSPPYLPHRYLNTSDTSME